MATKKGGLGRGLESLFNENSTEGDGAVTVRITDIEPNREQPRKDFDEESIVELSESIKRHGLIQPIVVRPKSNGTYEIIAGERRWRACRLAELDTVPVIVKDLDERMLKEIALVENLQREDLNAVEEALGYKSLIESYGLTQEQLAESVGKSRSAVTNALRLLGLNEKELEALRNGVITKGHARALLGIEDSNIRKEAFVIAMNGGSVRDIENLSRFSKKPSTKNNISSKPNFYKEVELALKSELGRKVNIKPTGEEKGTLTIEFFSKEELEDFVKRLSE